jgi:type II secretory pathway component GspD/PulD (secretin)
MAMSINKFWSAIIVFLIVLLSGGIFPAAPQEPSPGPPVTEEDRQLLLERLRERLQENNMQQPADRQFQGFPGQQQQPANRPFQGFPAQQQQPTPTTATPAAAPQQISLKQANGTLILSINDMDLNTFIQQISELLNLTPLVVDSEVKGNVTIHSSTPMSKEEVLALFHLILKTKNASLIKQNGIYQVVPISSALKTGVDLIERRTPEAKPETEPAAEPAQPPISRKTGRSGIAAPGSSEIPQLNINVVRVEYIPVKDLIEPIKLFMTEGGVIMPYERLNMLLLMDYSDSIDRILQIIHMLDNSYMDPDLIDLVKIEHNA